MKVSVFTGTTGHISGHHHEQYVIIHRSGEGSAFWGSEKLNLKFDPLNHTREIGTLSCRSKENSSRPNAGTVSRIQLKLGTEIVQPCSIT